MINHPSRLSLDWSAPRTVHTRGYPDFDSRFGIENGIDSTLYHIYIDNTYPAGAGRAGIGNTSREQYIHARGTTVSHPKPQKFPKLHKKSQKWSKITHFSNTFDNIYQTETLRGLKLGNSSGQGLRLIVCSDKKVVQYLRSSIPNIEATSKWRRFWCFRGFWPNGSSIVTKSGYSSAEAPYFDF